MPTYLPPRRGISASEAIAESRAFARVDEPELLTLAFYHSTFLDRFGQPTGLYFVCDFSPFTATLEADAPVHGGQEVTFQPLPVAVVFPEETDESREPSASIELDDVARLLSPLLSAASQTQEPVRMMVRSYLPSDTSAPHEMPPLSLELQQAQSDGTNVRLTAGYGDITNWPFPSVSYSADEGFSGLAASQG